MSKPKPAGAPISKMQSLLERGRAFLTPSGSSASLATKGGFVTAKTETALFPATDPKIDGDACLHDCASCTVHLPSKFSIDEDDKLYGHVKGWDTHLIVGTGKTDWVRDVADEEGSVMEAVGKYGQEIEMSDGRGRGKVMLSASNMPTGGQHGDCDMEEGSNCILLPAWTMIDKVKPDQVPALMQQVIGTAVTNKTPVGGVPKPQTNGTSGTGTHTPQPADGGTATPEEPPELSGLHIGGEPNGTISLSQPSIPRSLPSTFSIRPCPHQALILMCSHKTRDARCGQSAPLLRKEFERHLRPLGLYRDLHDERPGGVGIYYINHVGGHKYSANVMIYRRQGRTKPPGKGDENADGSATAALASEAVQGIWLARVRPEDCENIVKYTVLQGKVVKPQRQLRGGFDRERGMTSW